MSKQGMFGNVVEPIPFPEEYTASACRSDDSRWSRIYNKRQRRRIESFEAADCTSILIARFDRRQVYQLYPETMEYLTIPMPKGYDESIGLDDEYIWRQSGTETIGERLCNRYELFFKTSGATRPSQTVFVDAETGMRLQLISYNREGQVVFTGWWKDIVYGAPNEALFEVPADFKARKG